MRACLCSFQLALAFFAQKACTLFALWGPSQQGLHPGRLQVEELVAQGALITAKEAKKGRSTVHYAASHGHLDVLDFFATKGADLDADDALGRSPLMYAAAGTRPSSCMTAHA